MELTKKQKNEIELDIKDTFFELLPKDILARVSHILAHRLPPKFMWTLWDAIVFPNGPKNDLSLTYKHIIGHIDKELEEIKSVGFIKYKASQFNFPEKEDETFPDPMIFMRDSDIDEIIVYLPQKVH